MLFSSQLRRKLPIAHSLLQPIVRHDNLFKEIKFNQFNQKKYYQTDKGKGKFHKNDKVIINQNNTS